LKIKLLTASVAAVLLAGCGSDSDPVVKTYAVQAYDPAVINMKVTYDCGGDLQGEADELTTNYKGMVGYARIRHVDVVAAPQDCKFTFTPTPESVDVSNGKRITTTYTIPQGLAQPDVPVTGSPFTTLIAGSLEEGELYTPEVAEKVFTDLGIDINAIGVPVDELVRNTEKVVKDLEEKGQADEASKKLATQLAATANVVSDVIKANPEASAQAVSVSAKAITEEVIKANPDYPKSETGDVIVVEIPAEDTKKVVEQVEQDIKDEKPVDEIKPVVPPVPEPEKGEPVEPVDPPQEGSGASGGN
jgi:hypothetical protein